MKKKTTTKIMTNIDMMREYQTRIKPLLDELTKICELHKIPFMCSCAVFDNGKSTQYIHRGLKAADVGVTLTDDLFEKWLPNVEREGYISSVTEGNDIFPPLDLEVPEGMVLRAPNSRNFRMEDFEEVDLDPEVVMNQDSETESLATLKYSDKSLLEPLDEMAICDPKARAVIAIDKIDYDSIDLSPEAVMKQSSKK